MVRATAFALAFLLTLAGSPRASDTSDAALRDIARAQQHQAESLRRIETVERDRARREDTARQNAERDSRSLRRFDRPSAGR